MKNLSALCAGLIFGLGIALSGMINPAKVLNFFDVAGTWDPSLAFVMGGALATAAIGYRLIFGARQRPVFESTFALPTLKLIDAPLVAGSAVFGIGWGIAGFCPGGSIPALGLGDFRAVIFVVAMALGLTAARAMRNASSKPARA